MSGLSAVMSLPCLAIPACAAAGTTPPGGNDPASETFALVRADPRYGQVPSPHQWLLLDPRTRDRLEEYVTKLNLPPTLRTDPAFHAEFLAERFDNWLQPTVSRSQIVLVAHETEDQALQKTMVDQYPASLRDLFCLRDLLTFVIFLGSIDSPIGRHFWEGWEPTFVVQNLGIDLKSPEFLSDFPEIYRAPFGRLGELLAVALRHNTIWKQRVAIGVRDFPGAVRNSFRELTQMPPFVYHHPLRWERLSLDTRQHIVENNESVGKIDQIFASEEKEASRLNERINNWYGVVQDYLDFRDLDELHLFEADEIEGAHRYLRYCVDVLNMMAVEQRTGTPMAEHFANSMNHSIRQALPRIKAAASEILDLTLEYT